MTGSNRAASLRSRTAGLWHVRGGPPTTVVLAATAAITILSPSLFFAVQTVFSNPDRGVNIRELAPVAVASLLPALTVPTFDRRETNATRNARIGHFAFSTIALFTPLLFLPIWRTTVRARFPDQELPPMSGLVGNIMLFACIGTVAVLLLGRAASVIITPALFAGFVVGQQANPGSFLTTHFAYNLDWNTDWLVTTIATTATLALSWQRRALPLILRS